MSFQAISPQANGPTQTGTIDSQQTLTKQEPSSKPATKSTDSLEQPTQRHCIVRLALSILRALEKIPALGKFFKWLAEKLDSKGATDDSPSASAKGTTGGVTGGTETPPPPTPAFLFTQKYAQAFEKGLLKLAEKKKISQPEAQQATTALIEAFTAYRGAKDRLMELLDARGEKVKTVLESTTRQALNNFVCQLSQAVEEKVEDPNRTRSNAIFGVLIAALLVRAFQKQPEGGADDFFAWGLKVIAASKNPLEHKEKTRLLDASVYPAQIQHQMTLDSQFTKEACESRLNALFQPNLRQQQKKMILDVFNEILIYELMAKNRHSSASQAGETDTYNQKMLDAAKELASLQTSYEKELLKFAALLLPPSNKLKSLGELLPHTLTEQELKDPLVTTRKVKATKGSTLDLGQELLKEIGNIRLVAKNQTLLTDREKLVEKLSAVVQDELPKALPGAIQAFVTLYLQHCVTNEGKLVKQIDIDWGIGETLGKAVGRLLIQSLREENWPKDFEAIRKRLTSEEFDQLGDALGLALNYCSFFDKKRQEMNKKQINEKLRGVSLALYNKLNSAGGLGKLLVGGGTKVVFGLNNRNTYDRAANILGWRDNYQDNNLLNGILRQEAH